MFPKIPKPEEAITSILSRQRDKYCACIKTADKELSKRQIICSTSFSNNQIRVKYRFQCRSLSDCSPTHHEAFFFNWLFSIDVKKRLIFQRYFYHFLDLSALRYCLISSSILTTIDASQLLSSQMKRIFDQNYRGGRMQHLKNLKTIKSNRLYVI